jgi:GNAT superfamily N-acetyltransferase
MPEAVHATMSPSISGSGLEALDERSASRPARTSSPGPAGVLVLASGTRVRLRPVGAHDRDGLAKLFARLGPESRYRRFLFPKRELTPGELASLTDVDHVNDEAIAAVDQLDGSIVGVGQYARNRDRVGSASVAVAVEDGLQGMGLGTALARCTVQRARTNGFTLLTAATLWQNRPARALLRRLGFRAYSSEGGVIELELRLGEACGQPTNLGPRR